jgi:hypothetical protein
LRSVSLLKCVAFFSSKRTLPVTIGYLMNLKSHWIRYFLVSWPFHPSPHAPSPFFAAIIRRQSDIKIGFLLVLWTMFSNSSAKPIWPT